MATSTEVAIATTTLGSAASSITFSSIPSTYTDLRLVLTVKSSSGGGLVRVGFNADTGANYSDTEIYGIGTSAGSSRHTSSTQILFDDPSGQTSTTQPSLYTMDIFSYAGSTYKTCLLTSNEDFNGSGAVQYTVGLWRSTSAINSIKFDMNTGNYNAGTTATLYGIL